MWLLPVFKLFPVPAQPGLQDYDFFQFMDHEKYRQKPHQRLDLHVCIPEKNL